MTVVPPYTAYCTHPGGEQEWGESTNGVLAQPALSYCFSVGGSRQSSLTVLKQASFNNDTSSWDLCVHKERCIDLTHTHTHTHTHSHTRKHTHTHTHTLTHTQTHTISRTLTSSTDHVCLVYCLTVLLIDMNYFRCLDPKHLAEISFTS